MIEKRKIEPCVDIQECMKDGNYGRALVFLRDTQHPIMLQLFPRLKNQDFKPKNDTVALDENDVQALQKYIRTIRFWSLFGSIIYLLVGIAILVVFAVAIYLFFEGYTAFAGVACLALMLSPISLITLTLGYWGISNEVKSPFYSVI